MAGEIKLSESFANTEGGVLAKLWNKILKYHNLTSCNALDLLIRRYLNTTNAMNNRVQVVRRKNRSTLISNIGAEEMTIKIFFDLIFNLLNVKFVTFNIELTFPNGDKSSHSIIVNNGIVTKTENEEEPKIDGNSPT